MSNNLRYTKVRNVKSPVRGHKTDAGIDLFIPEDLSYNEMEEKFKITNDTLPVEFDENNKYIKTFVIRPNQSILIPSGLKFDIPDGYALIAHNKSGVATKKNLLVGASVADSGYEGEVHINLHNVGDENVKIMAGEKIVQFLLIPVVCCDVEEVSTVEELYRNKHSDRGEGGFGSTGV